MYTSGCILMKQGITNRIIGSALTTIGIGLETILFTDKSAIVALYLGLVLIFVGLIMLTSKSD